MTDRMLNAIESGRLSADLDVALKAAFAKIEAKIKTFADHYYDDDGQVTPIETRDVPGFMPYTNGGYELELRGLISLADSEGVYPAQVADMVEQYAEASDVEDAGGDDAGWADGFYRYVVRSPIYLKENFRSESKQDEVFFCAGINPYSPGEHGEKVDWLFERGVLIADLTPAVIEAIGDEIIVAFEKSRERQPAEAAA